MQMIKVWESLDHVISKPHPVLEFHKLPERYSFFFFFLLFRAAPKAYGGSQARGQIGATASGLQAHVTATATQDPSCVCDLHQSSWQGLILNTLSKARDRT